MARKWSGAVAPQMEAAILAAADAGCFREAARLNPKAASMWEAYAKASHEEAARLLRSAMTKMCRGRRLADGLDD